MRVEYLPGTKTPRIGATIGNRRNIHANGPRAIHSLKIGLARKLEKWTPAIMRIDKRKKPFLAARFDVVNSVRNQANENRPYNQELDLLTRALVKGYRTGGLRWD